VVGKTGSVECTIDETGQITCAPIPEADAVREEMFDLIKIQAMATVHQLISETGLGGGVLAQAAEALNSAETPASAFRHLDASGDGEVTTSEVLSYGGGREGPLGSFLSFVKETMALGEGGEVIDGIPGVTLEMLSNPGPRSAGYVQSLEADMTGLTSRQTVKSSGHTNLANFAFCDGSVRFISEGITSLREFEDARFAARLSPLDPAENYWSGQVWLTDATGNSVKGVLIGFQSPGQTPAFEALVMGAEGKGHWSSLRGTGWYSWSWMTRGWLTDQARSSGQIRFGSW
jgi:prepilin-type processing-associated H-X9-DG protein